MTNEQVIAVILVAVAVTMSVMTIHHFVNSAPISYRKVGGIRFVRVAKLGFSFYLTSKPIR